MIKVISFEICPFVQRVTAALEVRNIPYKIEYISLKDKPQWFLDLSPNGQVPVMITENNTALFESDAIVEYIEDEFGPLEQKLSNEQRAQDRAWSYLGSKNYLSQCGAMSSKDESTFQQRTKNLRTVFKKIEKQLTDSAPFFKSNQLSNVDIAWLPLLHRAHIVKEHSGYDILCCLPKTQAWQQAILSTKLGAKSVSSDFIDRFRTFYLTNTHVATLKERDEACCEKQECCNKQDCCDSDKCGDSGNGCTSNTCCTDNDCCTSGDCCNQNDCCNPNDCTPTFCLSCCTNKNCCATDCCAS